MSRRSMRVGAHTLGVLVAALVIALAVVVSAPRYQVVDAAGPTVVRMDVRSGEMVMCRMGRAEWDSRAYAVRCYVPPRGFSVDSVSAAVEPSADVDVRQMTIEEYRASMREGVNRE